MKIHYKIDYKSIFTLLFKISLKCVKVVGQHYNFDELLSVTYLLTYLLIYLFTYLLTYYLPTYLLTYLLTYLPTYLLTDLLN